MEKLCKIRDIQRGIMAFEQSFAEYYGICLNEAMVLCSINNSENGKLTSGEIGELLGLTSSNTSKVICSIEKKEFVERSLGTTDKRQMYFSLTTKGAELLASIKCDKIVVPEVISQYL